MKKTFLMAAVCCPMVLAISSSAYSAGGPYVSGNLGFAMLDDSEWTDSTLPGATIDVESDSGLALGVAAGYAFNANIRMEGEIAYQKNDVDDAKLLGVSVDATGNFSSLAFLLNSYYDFANKSAFTPFINGGIGLAKVEINDFNTSGSGESDSNEDDTVFAYQVGGGIGYAITKKITLDIKYRYFGTSDPDFDTVSAEYGSHNFYAGLRVAF